MANTYTYTKVEGDFEISRGDEHVATYDPITEDTTYTNGSDRFAGPIGRQVKSIVRSMATSEVETPSPDTQPVNPFTLEQHVELQELVKKLNAEIVQLKNPEGPAPVAARYVGIDFSNPDAPKMGMAGDKTPEFIEWARYGGFTAAEFKQCYGGRIEDTTYKG
jgi:hypothetical protein